MASSGVNVIRFSALGFGVAYGIWHQSNLTAQTKRNRDYQHQLSLVEKAKKEHAKKSSPQQGVISDPDDPRFDLEAYLNTVAE